VSICIADFAISCHEIADTSEIHISTFKTTLGKQLEPLLSLRVLLVAITREENVFSLLGSNNIHGWNIHTGDGFLLCLPSFCAIQIKERFWICNHWHSKVEESSRLRCWV